MCGYVWICADMCGYVWICVDMCGYVWICVDGCGYLWMDPRSMAWVRHSMGIMSRPLGKISFFCQNAVFLTIFPLGRSNCLQITKNNFSRFLAFYPLISAFQALWRSSWRRTFRDLSLRIINSSFHAVWLDIQIFDRFSIDVRYMFNRFSIDFR